MTTTFFIVSFQSDFFGGFSGREFATRQEAELFAASLMGADACDIVIEEVRE